MENKNEKNNEKPAVDRELCYEHRRKLGLIPKNIEFMKCDEMRECFKGCPMPPDERVKQAKPIPTFGKPTKDNPLGINMNVYKEIEADKPKKEKKISEETKDFLDLQARVIQKLAWHPEIYKALDKLSTSEIMDKLLGKSGLELVPKNLGGGMNLKTSPEAKKMFAKLESEFAEEDEKNGKGAPPDYEKEEGNSEEFMWGTFPPFSNKKEGKKNAKKTD